MKMTMKTKMTTIMKTIGIKKNAIIDTVPTLTSFISQKELLKWLEKITNSKTSVYDKALDSNYLKTHIAGGNHRLFDGGHDLLGAWESATKALDNDSFSQEVIGYVSAIWKDITTVKGIPFITWSKEIYDNFSDWLVNNIPYTNKEWCYDLCSYDVFEIFGATLSTVTALFLLDREDNEKLSEILGSMGIISIISANPLTGISVILLTAYSYKTKKLALKPTKVIEGITISAISMTIFAVLGFPILIELGIVITVSKIIKEHIFNSNDLIKYLSISIKKNLYKV